MNKKQFIKMYKDFKGEKESKKTLYYVRFSEDFINVIDKKYKEWKGTETEKYVRPETLFGDKFESYVNQKEKKGMFDDVDLNSLYANFK